MTQRVLVAGGGLAGLVAARHLAAGDHDVTVFERRDAVGGRVRSTRRDGFVLDRGFQVLFTAYPAARRELDYDALDLRAFTPGACLARPGERSVLSDPLRDPRGGLASLANREVGLGDKLRTLRLRYRLGRTAFDGLFEGPDASIGAYLRERGFSRRFVENFVAPFYGGITLDRSLATSAAVFETTFKAMSEGRIVVPAGGMGAIPEQLADRARSAGATIETGTAVEAVGADGSVRVGGETVDGDAVVVATDPPTARELTGVDAIPTAGRGCVTGYYALPTPDALGGDPRLVLNVAGDAGPNHVAPLSAAAPSYAPDGRTLLSATFLGDPDADDAALAERTRDALASWYPERGFGDLECLRLDRIPFAQFDQPPGFHAGLPAVDAPAGPVFLAGEYTRWSSIQGAMESGRVAARRVEALNP